METQELRTLLESVQAGSVSLESAMEQLRRLPFEDLGYAKVDHHRAVRTGYPEVIYCAGKTPGQIVGILRNMLARGTRNILGTRLSQEAFEKIAPELEGCPLQYDPLSRVLVVKREAVEMPETHILVATAGTSDMPVAEEAAITAETFGNKVERIYDVGVAGIHRLLSYTDRIMSANVVIAVAGMEGALPSVLGGLVDKPVIAVPTSVGYGANFGGLSALLTMINSCASGISVVNIDNGFGAGYLASMINRMPMQH